MKVFSEAEDHRINQLRTVNAIIAGNVLGIITVFFGNNYFTGFGLGIMLGAIVIVFNAIKESFIMKMLSAKFVLTLVLCIFLILIGYGFFYDKFKLYPSGLQGNENLELVRCLAMPSGIDLTKTNACEKLLKLQDITDLRIETENWSSFMIIVPFSHEKYQKLNIMAVPGHGQGFFLCNRTFDGKELIGRKFFFDDDYEQCDNMLISNRPLRSAKFVMCVLNPQSSGNFTNKGMVLLFLRVLGEHWNEYVLLSDGRS